MPHQSNGHAAGQTLTNGNGVGSNYFLVGKNGHATSAVPVTAPPTGGKVGVSSSKVNPADPQVRKLVYNMYRGMLANKHDKSSAIVETVPQHQVMLDEGIGDRLQSMLLSDPRRQQSEIREGNMNAGGPPPPPPPPPLPGVIPAARLPSEIPRHLPQKAPPMALAGAMMKEKKPFTYTPGGIDLSEINTQYRPQQNGSVAPNAPTTNGTSNPNAPNSAPNNPVQSRAFRVLQNVLDTNDTAGSDDEIWNYMQHSEPQVHQSDQELQQTQQIQNPQQTNFQQNYPQQYDGAVQQQSIPQQLKQNQNDSPQQRFQQLQEQAAGTNSPKESKFMRLLQTVTDTLPEGAEPQGPVHLPNLRKKIGQPHAQQQQQQQLHQQPNATPIGSQLGGDAPVPSEQQVAPEPKKYMGGAIPSRSFKMLQQMTASDDVAGPGQTDL